MVSTEIKLWFLSSLEHFWPDPWETLSKVALFFEKIHKVFKNKAQGCSTPLTIDYSKIKKRNVVLINNATYQRETLSERPIRQPLSPIHLLR